MEIEFTNRLPEPTVIHWHGLRIPSATGGTEVVQRAIQPDEIQIDHPFHLHGFFVQVLEHHAAGMMAHFEVKRP